MTLELNLSPELEAQLRAESALRRVPVETLAAHVISAGLAFSNRYSLPVESQIVTTQMDAAQKRRDAAAAGFGMFAGQGMAVDEFINERSAQEGNVPVLPKEERRGVSRLKGRYPDSRTVADFMADRSAEEGSK